MNLLVVVSVTENAQFWKKGCIALLDLAVRLVVLEETKRQKAVKKRPVMEVEMMEVAKGQERVSGSDFTQAEQ